MESANTYLDDLDLYLPNNLFDEEGNLVDELPSPFAIPQDNNTVELSPFEFGNLRTFNSLRATAFSVSQPPSNTVGALVTPHNANTDQSTKRTANTVTRKRTSQVSASTNNDLEDTGSVSTASTTEPVQKKAHITATTKLSEIKNNDALTENEKEEARKVRRRKQIAKASRLSRARRKEELDYLRDENKKLREERSEFVTKIRELQVKVDHMRSTGIIDLKCENELLSAQLDQHKRFVACFKHLCDASIIASKINNEESELHLRSLEQSLGISSRLSGNIVKQTEAPNASSFVPVPTSFKPNSYSLSSYPNIHTINTLTETGKTAVGASVCHSSSLHQNIPKKPPVLKKTKSELVIVSKLRKTRLSQSQSAKKVEQPVGTKCSCESFAQLAKFKLLLNVFEDAVQKFDNYLKFRNKAEIESQPESLKTAEVLNETKPSIPIKSSKFANKFARVQLYKQGSEAAHEHVAFLLSQSSADHWQPVLIPFEAKIPYEKFFMFYKYQNDFGAKTNNIEAAEKTPRSLRKRLNIRMEMTYTGLNKEAVSNFLWSELCEKSAQERLYNVSGIELQPVIDDMPDLDTKMLYYREKAFSVESNFESSLLNSGFNKNMNMEKDWVVVYNRKERALPIFLLDTPTKSKQSRSYVKKTTNNLIEQRDCTVLALSTTQHETFFSENESEGEPNNKTSKNKIQSMFVQGAIVYNEKADAKLIVVFSFPDDFEAKALKGFSDVILPDGTLALKFANVIKQSYDMLGEQQLIEQNIV